jgi:hypothetical protein
MHFVRAIALAIVVGCSSTPYDVRESREPFPPPDLQSLSPVERLGWTIYRHDRAAWSATDQALAQGLGETPAAGWITVEQDFGSILVRFAGPCGNAVCSYLDVATGSGIAIVTQGAPDPLPPDQAGAWRARKLVSSAEFRACTPRYNTVVLPTEHDGEPAWVVYLLASSTEPDDVILTGHHRFTVSFEGDQVLKAEALSNSCIVSKAKESVVAPFVTHVLHPEPIETHVFTSLDYHLPLYVGTEKGTYEVRGASVRLVKAR